ncbi:hypothetical protein O9929_24595 [Vibrio lentus]|nr:hypothetical protein [Vibrio lentus]
MARPLSSRLKVLPLELPVRTMAWDGGLYDPDSITKGQGYGNVFSLAPRIAAFIKLIPCYSGDEVFSPAPMIAGVIDHNT